MSGYRSVLVLHQWIIQYGVYERTSTKAQSVNTERTKNAIKVEWENLEQDIIDNALKSWPKRCRLIYYVQGSHIEHLLQ